MRALPPYENVLFDSTDALRDACVDLAKSKDYVVNQRDFNKKRGRLRLKCAHKTTTKQGGGGVRLRQSTTNNGLPFPDDCMGEWRRRVEDYNDCCGP
jgi:hypothetical protein